MAWSRSAYFAAAAWLGGWRPEAMPPLLVLPAVLLVHLGSVAGYGWIERPDRHRLHALLRRENLFATAATAGVGSHAEPHGQVAAE